jgi:chemotaxis protein histidine kinase CheA
METTQTNVESPNFQTVWAALQEVAALQKEAQKEAEQRQKEAQKEAEQRQKETDRQIKEAQKDFNKRFGEFTNRFGEIVEYMVAPNLQKKFWEMGLSFPNAYPNAEVCDYDNNIFLEIDIKLENGDKAMLVEVKTKLTTEDVKDHVKRLKKMRVYADLHGDRRTFLGAVAGVVMTQNAKNYALGQGFYVVEPSGETFNITSPDGKPKEW